MKVTKVEVVRSRRPITLPEIWRPAWWEPDVKPIRSFGFSFYKIHTDENIVGIGPHADTGAGPDAFAMSALVGSDPFYVERFWNACLGGRGPTFNRGSYGGLEIALWDIIGKALGKQVYKILGACRDRIMAYAATSRLLKAEEYVKQVSELVDKGFKAVKLRLHRPNPEDDLEVVKAVRDAAGDDLLILVDANQNSKSINYRYWSRKTAAKELDRLKVYFFEEPLPRRDLEGLAELATSVDMYIAGGEHSASVYEFKKHVLRGAYDVLQPNVILGDIGIIGIRKVAFMADYFSRIIIPHVCSAGNCALGLAATLQAVATVENCPMIEYPCDPPILTVDTQQRILKNPMLIDGDGFLKIPEKPGIGIEIDEEKVSKHI